MTIYRLLWLSKLAELVVQAQYGQISPQQRAELEIAVAQLNVYEQTYLLAEEAKILYGGN